jgi:hypothetical protein
MMASRYGLVIAFAVLAIVGCAKDKWTSQRPKVVRASGRVVYNGQPLEGAHVTFTNPAAKVSAFGRTDADGKFTLTTYEPNDGAVPGSQQVSVSKVKLINPLDPAIDRTTTTAKLPKTERRWLIPQRYGSMQTSGLSVDIPESGKDGIVLELQGDPG